MKLSTEYNSAEKVEQHLKQELGNKYTITTMPSRWDFHLKGVRYAVLVKKSAFIGVAVLLGRTPAEEDEIIHVYPNMALHQIFYTNYIPRLIGAALFKSQWQEVQDDVERALGIANTAFRKAA